MSNLSIGPFDLINTIGKGSMGVVWEAIHRDLGKHVAIKVLTALGAQDENFRQSFTNEVRAVARLHHPSIIRILDYGITSEELCKASNGEIAAGSQYYTMELATGGTLPKPTSPLPWLQMRFLLLELLDALAHAHARNVIHRDIKPGNILLMHDGDTSRVMLTDFGIAKAIGTIDLPDGTVAGTPRYMAPEQILNLTRDQGPWTDLYSIGCLAYLLATGKRIFTHAKAREVLRCHLYETPEPVTGAHLPEGFQGWLSKMLAKKVYDRFEYASEAAWELVCLPDPVESEPAKPASVTVAAGTPADTHAPKTDGKSEDSCANGAAKLEDIDSKAECFGAFDESDNPPDAQNRPDNSPDLSLIDPSKDSLSDMIKADGDDSPDLSLIDPSKDSLSDMFKAEAADDRELSLIDLDDDLSQSIPKCTGIELGSRLPTVELHANSEMQNVTTPVDSGDNEPVNPASSSIFRTLYQPDQLSLQSSHQDSGVQDIAADLLADMGETIRMEAKDIEKVLADQSPHEQAESKSESKSHVKHDLSTLAEVYRQRLEMPKLVYDNRQIVPAPKTWRREAFEDDFGQMLGAGLGLWGLRPIPMVGRDHERDVIYDALLKTREDRTIRCIMLDGPRGTGKSRIIEWMTQRAHELSIAHTLKAQHYEDHLNAPGIARAMMFYLTCQNLPRHEALERILAFLDEHPLEPEYADALPMLELMELHDDPEHPVPKIHFATIEEQFAVLARFLKRICHDRAAVLWLDDVHYSTYSMAFVEYMLTAQKEGPIPLLILATSRSEDLETETHQAAVYERLLQLQNVTQMDVQPLDPKTHLELVHQLIGLDDELCQQVAQRTSGMPLFAIQLVGDWVERGLLVPGPHGFQIKEGASVALPDSLHELWIDRLRLIFRDSKQVSSSFEQLEIAACLGAQFDADEWRITCEIAELGSNLKTLECMLAHQLFEIHYPTIRFTHELLRESLIRYTKENGRFKRNHMFCAEMLESYFSEVLTFYHERRAEHLLAAKAYEACIEPLLQAAMLRRQRSEFDAAHALYKKREFCLNECKADENSPIRALGWLGEADTWLQETNLDAAEPLIHKAAELGLRTKSPVIRALANKENGILLHYRNNIAESIDALMTALAAFNEIGERRRAAYQSDRAETLWLIGRICDTRHELELARIYLKQAIEIQTQLNDTYGLAKSYNTLGNTLQHGGFFEDARQSLEYALKLFEKMGFRIYQAHCLIDIGEIYRLGYDMPEEAEAYYKKALEIYHELNTSDNGKTVIIINLVLLMLSKQRFSEAKTLVLNEIDRIEQNGQDFDLNWLYAELLPCCAASFDWPTFEDVLSRLECSLDASLVVDNDILYCTEMAWHMSERLAPAELIQRCRNIAIQQALKLNDAAALTRLRYEE
ncbi:MAG: protein kinase [Proteobacteria bacterium]|nr:protein kinase [Pseudomonadota bacterium]